MAAELTRYHISSKNKLNTLIPGGFGRPEFFMPDIIVVSTAVFSRKLRTRFQVKKGRGVAFLFTFFIVFR